MSTTFSTINTGLSALRAFQAAQNVAGGNITNVSTKGYTRREVVLAPSSNGGVDVAGVRRICDKFAQRSMRSALGEAACEGAVRDALVGAESAINPLAGGGVYSSLGTFWESMQALSSNPSDAGVRRNTVASAQNLAASVNSLSGNLGDLQLNLGDKAATDVDTVNGLLSNVADLNKKIQQAESSGQAANELRDSRDAALDGIAGYMDIDVSENDMGVVVSAQGRMLLSSDSYNKISANLEGNGAKTLTFTVGPDNASLAVSGGSLAGYSSAVGEVQALRDGVSGVLDTLASTADGSINALHADGYTLSGDKSMQALFVKDGGGRLQVNPIISADPSRLAASAGGSEGDGGNASAMAEAMKKGWGTTAPVENSVSSLASELGSRVSMAESRAKNADALKESAQNSYDSVSGVSLDEESAKLIELQNSYAAAAKFISTFNETMTTLLSIV